jgi:hypothetical protein
MGKHARTHQAVHQTMLMLPKDELPRSADHHAIIHNSVNNAI